MRGIVIGQRISAEKRERAKELRRVMTVAEACLWTELRANRLNGWRFRRQQVIDGFIVDFYCNALALVIEVDGLVHDEQQEADRERDAILAARGLTILRFTNDEVRHSLPSVLARIEAIASPQDIPPL